MTPDKEHAPALMQQAADEAVAVRVRLVRGNENGWEYYDADEAPNSDTMNWKYGALESEAEVERLYPADTIATLTAQLAAAEERTEQGLAAGLEMAAKVAENAAKEFLSEEYAVGQPLASFSERFACQTVASAIRALADQHKPSPATPEPASEAWPAGCVKRSSCARHKQCMYGTFNSCRHQSRNIAAEVEAAAGPSPAEEPMP